MSNLTISQLPEWTGNTEGFYLPANNSGETITYKITRETLFSGASGTSGTSGSSGSSGSSGTSGLGFNYQGGWQNNITYYENDVVFYNGSSWVALTTISIGQNPPDINANWGELAIAGASGSSGTSGTSGSSGTSGTSGSSGSSGSSGVSGTSGSSGSSGISGTSGSSGSSGISGTSGSSGTDGTSGSSGQSNSVYSGGTLVVSGATILNFSGATITSGATPGQANITIIPSVSGLISGTGVDSIVSSSALTQTYGTNPISSGLASIAIGSSNPQATQTFTTAIGWNARATADGAISIGTSNIANGNQACVIGYASSAGGTDSFCGGVESNSGGFRSVAVGKYAAATGSESVAIGNAISSEASYGTTLGGIQLIRNSQYSSIVGGRSQVILTNTSYNNIFGASDSNITTTAGSGGLNTIIGGKGNNISGATSGATLLGMTNYVPTTNNAAFAMAYVMTNYAALDFANDTAAAAGGVVLGQIYHHNGDMKIRIV